MHTNKQEKRCTRGEQMHLALDPALAREIRGRTCRVDYEMCTMCRELCAYKADVV
jgi:thiamine biosynthesis protein ThiC